MTFIGDGYVQFKVYTPNAAQHWSAYQTRWWRAPFIWLLWLVRGVRARLWGAPLGRPVTLADMLATHPGKPGKCLCRGTGILTTYRKGEEGVQFCARMLTAFRETQGFRLSDAKGGPRWIRGFAPEELVGARRRG